MKPKQTNPDLTAAINAIAAQAADILPEGYVCAGLVISADNAPAVLFDTVSIARPQADDHYRSDIWLDIRGGAHRLYADLMRKIHPKKPKRTILKWIQ